MLVYKYMTLQGLDACLSKRTIRFTKPANFNDPFDCAAAAGVTMGGLNMHPVGSTNADKLFMIRNGIGILSLTRNPLNPLMWAHYGENHSGGVIAIDTEEAGLECTEANIIPASAGNVIYTTVRPSVDGDHLPYHDEITAQHDRLMLERLFLYKSLHWSYEEEIRVARRVDYTPQVRHQDFVVPSSAIKAVYLGAKYFHALTDNWERQLPRVHLKHPKYEMYHCYQDPQTWDLHAERYDPESPIA
ncbi:DUF2971 domain-containing protein [Pseudomonas shirazica]|uniref:DUF2971 domain-containing protein n=1 Tax=Pseudomonas shirazica TaxID=1940636 RepID=UPI0025AA2083|nr:DUF2971 domain-containing protein [Pseudomonas shirazica]MDM9599236.1 DUF2971 domain-containing protein [Pseudomonas shirazica]MDO2412664.1 DUF2971 domain-containing protein [Pseudomonas shirazica]